MLKVTLICLTLNFGILVTDLERISWMFGKTVCIALPGIMSVNICFPDVPSDLTFATMKVILEPLHYIISLVIMDG